MGSLAKALLMLGFIPVLGTFETCGKERHIVSRGAPKRFDYKNGVIVVYDELGAPWIVNMADVTIRKVRDLAREYHLSDGVYVPHSKDGGSFIRGNLPSVSAPS